MAELLAFHQVFSDRQWILLIRLFQVLRGTSVSDVSIFVGQQAISCIANERIPEHVFIIIGTWISTPR